MKTRIPESTAAESETLELHICDWLDRTPIEQAICLAVLRGFCYPSQITTYLGIEEHDVDEALAALSKNGLVWGKGDRLLLR